jgi:hypothetical protein
MSAPKGNKYASEWTLENAKPRFEDALKFAETDETCLCLQDAIYHSGIPYSTFYYLADNQEVLEDIKKGINAAVIRRVNRLALERIQPVSATAAIWRMKQLGERDEQHINTTGSTTTNVVVSDAKAAKAVNDLIEKFEKE